MREKLDSRLQRVRTGLLASSDDYGNNGAFTVTGPKGKLNVIVSDGGGWDHVSVTVKGKDRTPTWEEMSFVKGLCFDPEETVIQFHPPENRYVNNHPGCLHLWRPQGVDIPLPPTAMVGIRR